MKAEQECVSSKQPFVCCGRQRAAWWQLHSSCRGRGPMVASTLHSTYLKRMSFYKNYSTVLNLFLKWEGSLPVRFLWSWGLGRARCTFSTMRVVALLHIRFVGRSGKWIHITSNGQNNVASDLTSKEWRKECKWAEPKLEKHFLWQILKATLISHTKCNRVGTRTLERAPLIACSQSLLTATHNLEYQGGIMHHWWGCIQHPTLDLYWIHCEIIGHSNCLSDPKLDEGVELEIWQDCMLLLTVPQWWYWGSLRSSGLTEAYI